MSIWARLNTSLRFIIACGFFLTFPCASSFSEPMNLSLLRVEIENYHRSGTYEKEVKEILARAQEYLIQAAAANKKELHPKKLAIVLDIDETSLSNYGKMVKRHFLSIPQQIHQEILDANSPPLAGALELYKAALDNKVDIFFVTGRRESEREATRQNLIRAGFKDWTALHLRPDIYTNTSIVPFKSKVRKTIADQGYTIIASVGDQQSDFDGGNCLRQFKLPNPFYFLP